MQEESDNFVLTTTSRRDLAKLLRATGHPKRIEIINLLALSKTEYSQILRETRLGRTALANHLNILVKNGLISRVERGTYELTKDGSEFYRAIVETYSQSQIRADLEHKMRLEKYTHIRNAEEQEMKIISKLKWQPRWVSHLGCVEGCLKYLKRKISTGWLYGGTGHAFILNIAKDLCPSGPTAWRTDMLYQLAPNLGYRVEGIFARKNNAEFPKEQEKAWTHAKKCIDNNIPCYGWELKIAEFYVINGYNDFGYFFSGPGYDDGTGPMPWKEIGTSQIGVLEVYSVHPQDSADPVKAIKQSFERILYHSTNPSDVIFPNYRSGLAGYDWWITAIENGSASSMGNSYNTAIWSECRKYAVDFLKESRKYVNQEVRKLIDEARKQYEIVAHSLGQIENDYPFSLKLEHKPIGIDKRTDTALNALRNAKNAEGKGLEILNEIVSII
ncbi:MAG: winged helix-turn-helix transcriptional regulator [Candidatus Thorarchaeota archaeon]|nr:winged helix-turn-helix transcriptional regulator [Candidatus Thorarchaeota archaeon]